MAGRVSSSFAGCEILQQEVCEGNVDLADRMGKTRAAPIESAHRRAGATGRSSSAGRARGLRFARALSLPRAGFL